MSPSDYGEPSFGGWPHTTSTFGSFDLSGFPKPAAWWYRMNWLFREPDTSASKPFPTGSAHAVRIVQDWESPPSGTLDINAYSDLPEVELRVNGRALQRRALGDATSGRTFAEWRGVPFSAGNLTAVGYDSAGVAQATHTVRTAGAAVAIQLSLDVPSQSTGTGSALVLDGRDTGLVRATIVDGDGHVVTRSATGTNNVSFEIVSGPGRIVGTNNGDPSSHEPNQVSWHSAFHGLVRAVVRVTEVNDGPSRHWHRSRLAQIDVEAGSTRVLASSARAAPIVVRASSPGLLAATVEIPTSSDAGRDSVLAVARSAAGRNVPGA